MELQPWGSRLLKDSGRCLLSGGVVLGPPALYQDNQSAMAVIETGGTRRTRCCATRAARLSGKHRLKTNVLRYCPTKLMSADGLTTLTTAEVHQNMRDEMQGRLPDVSWGGDAHEGR